MAKDGVCVMKSRLHQDFNKGSIFPGYISALSYNTLKSDTALLHKACGLPLSDEEEQKWKKIAVSFSIAYIPQQFNRYPIQHLALLFTPRETFFFPPHFVVLLYLELKWIFTGIVCHESHLKVYLQRKKNICDYISVHPGCCEIP